jgi:anti-sigma-K factor RskA
MALEPTIGSDEHELDDVALEALAEAYAEPAPQQLRVRLLGAVAREREHAGAARRIRRARVVGALAASLAIVCAGVLARELQLGRARSGELATLTERNNELAARIDEQSRTLASLRESLDTQAQILRLVGGPRVRSASLAPRDGGGATGRVLVDATSGETAVVVSGLPPPTEGKAYELWAIRGNRPPEAAGLLTVSAQRGAATSVPNIEAPNEVTAFAISIEPHGGSTSPTGPIVLVGTVT